MRVVLTLALSVLASASWAHGDLPTPTWCSDGRPVTVATFSFKGETLPNAAQCPGVRDNVDNRDCGQFDDDYGTARGMALTACEVHQLSGPGDIGSVLVIVDSPATYNDADHHALYDVSQGLSGRCVRCEPLRTLPPPPGF